jgi:hypothetical protein
MASVVRFTGWRVRTGYREFMRSAEVRAALFETAAQIHEDAGGDAAGFVLQTQDSSGRRATPRAAIIAASFDAQKAEAENRVLTRAFEKNRDV